MIRRKKESKGKKIEKGNKKGLRKGDRNWRNIKEGRKKVYVHVRCREM